MENQKKTEAEASSVFKVGAVALAFLIVGYQTALFVNRAAESRIVANRDAPDTVYVVDEALAAKVLGVDGGGYHQLGSSPFGLTPPSASADGPPSSVQRVARSSGSMPSAGVVVRKTADHPDGARKIYASAPAAKAGEDSRAAVRKGHRTVENFRFNPNTASIDDFVRLGFSEKQAQSIINYRSKGGRFRRKSDFAKSYVVADSVYKRLEPYIVIPRLDINKADSAAFDSLPGIGGYFARKMVEYRERLGGYSCTEQLMEIWHFDREKYDRLADLITCSPAPAFPLWSAPADTLRLHPHIRSWQTARAIVLYRQNNPPERLTVEGLLAAGILTDDQAAGLARCRLR